MASTRARGRHHHGLVGSPGLDGHGPAAAPGDHADRGSGADCGGDGSDPTLGAPPATPGTSQQSVTVEVAPTVRVEEDRRGRLTILTNALRPPAPGDLVYLRSPDGTYAAADAALTTRVLAARWELGPSWCVTTSVHESRGPDHVVDRIGPPERAGGGDHGGRGRPA